MRGMSPPFVITGCGNSGTKYVARLLSTLGVRTAWEEFFIHATTPADVAGYLDWLLTTDTKGESSSLAAPYVSKLPPGTLVFHQVRNPVAVIRSLMGRETFMPKWRNLPNLRFFFRHLRGADHDDEPIVLAMKYWLGWNRLVGNRCRPALRYRVESLSDVTSGTLTQVLVHLNVTWRDKELSCALEKYGTTFHGGKRDESVTWDSLPDCWLKEMIAVSAKEYGYSERDLEEA